MNEIRLAVRHAVSDEMLAMRARAGNDIIDNWGDLCDFLHKGKAVIMRLARQGYYGNAIAYDRKSVMASRSALYRILQEGGRQ